MTDQHGVTGDLTGHRPGRGPELVGGWSIPRDDEAPGWGTWSVPRTALISRQRERDDVRLLLLDPSVALVTLTGPGGVGKTRLALDIATTLRAGPEFAGVAFVPLASLTDPERVPPAIARGLGLSSDSVQPMDAIVDALAGRPALLVLDNCEQVLAVGPTLAALLARLPLLTILATSRSGFRISGEREYAIGPLATQGPDVVATRQLAERLPAVELFVERARAVDARFRAHRRQRQRHRGDLPAARRSAAGDRAGRRPGPALPADAASEPPGAQPHGADRWRPRSARTTTDTAQRDRLEP